MIFIGIDPGWHGAIASIERLETGKKITRVWKMPETELGIAALAKKLATLKPRGVVLEAVSSRPGQGAGAMWKFANNYFAWRMALLLVEIDYDLVIPQTWQKPFDLIVPGLSQLTGKEFDRAKRAKKNKHKDAAQQMFPGLKVTLDNCDALLMARFAELRFTSNRKFQWA